MLGLRDPLYFPIAEVDDSIGPSHRLLAMGSHDNRLAVIPIQLLEQIQDRSTRHRIQVPSWLVGQDNPRLGHNRPGYRYPLLLATG
jgi:hypothetical protein